MILEIDLINILLSYIFESNDFYNRESIIMEYIIHSLCNSIKVLNKIILYCRLYNPNTKYL